jgi:RHS repeat-associated protein
MRNSISAARPVRLGVAARWCVATFIAFVGCSGHHARDERVLGSNSMAVVSGLVAAYGFEEGTGTIAADASTNHLTGTVSGAVWARGRFGNALRFNGTSDWVTVADAQALHLTTGMTLSAWVQPTVPMSGKASIVVKEVTGNSTYALYANGSTNQANSTFRSGTQSKSVAGGSALPVNTWTYVAATYNGSTFSLYINGSLAASNAVTGSINVSTGVLRFGGNTVGEYFAGLIDEVRVYNRALSESEITTDMNTPITSPGLILPVMMGEPGVLPGDDSGNGELLVAQQTYLAEAGTLQSLSLYASQAAGRVRLGVYDSTGEGGNPGTKLAETAEITPVDGWNTASVSPVSLSPGSYWLVHLPSTDDLHVPSSPFGAYVQSSVDFGPMPATYPDINGSGATHWAVYATLTAASGPCMAPGEPLPAATSCSDGNPCNGDETCDGAGHCQTGTPLVCAPLDQCHVAGTCDPASGCSNPVKRDGAACNDGNACTVYDICHAGTCSGDTVPGCDGTRVAVEDLGTFEGDGSGAYGINDSGVTVGFGWNSVPGLPHNYRAARWFRGSTDIHMVGADDPQAYISSFHAINNAGVIAGRLGVNTGCRYSDATGFQIIVPDGTPGIAGAINDSNSVAGSGDKEAFRYTDQGGFQFLGLLDHGLRTMGSGIDNQNNVVGDSIIAGTTQWDNSHAFRYSDATDPHLRDLSKDFAPFGWILRTARGTNGDEIVGFAEHDSKIEGYRLTLSTGQVDDLGALVPGSISFATSINAQGAIGGSSYVDQPHGDRRATVWTEQLGLLRLEDFTPTPTDWILVETTALNNQGEVVGVGYRRDANDPTVFHPRGFRMKVPGLSPARVPRCTAATAATDCPGGFCAEGICCNTACDGPCLSCRVSGHYGTCLPKPSGSACPDGDKCNGNETCDGAGVCHAGTDPVVCPPADSCHPSAGTCDPATGFCSQDALPCSAGCPCEAGKTCTSDAECMPGLVCGKQNGRQFGKDPMSNNCWAPLCEIDPHLLGCDTPGAPCGACDAKPPVCTSNAPCQATNQVCGQGNGTHFDMGTVNVCWPSACPTGACGKGPSPCGGCDCVDTCPQKTCATVDKSDGCGGYCAGLCGDGQTGCTADYDCQSTSTCVAGTCVPRSCTELDPSRPTSNNPMCGTPPQCISACGITGRECGPDPTGCKASCGDCGGGTACVNGKCIGGGTPVPVQDTVGIGSLDGSFNVSESGDAQYRIPIDVPPGRAGLQPDLALVYTSGKRLGPAGMGWQLSGFSSIARCVRTIDQDDGDFGPIRYDASDKYCLDGKRLVPFANGEYRTEVDEFSKIIPNGVTAGGPSSFTVYTKAGTILTYGDSEDSSVYHAGSSGPVSFVKRVWGLSRIEDRNGNSIHFTYEARRFSALGIPGDTFEMVPIEVSYGSNESVSYAADRSVRFVYEDAGIKSLHFVAGGKSMLQRRLKAIETYVRASLVRRYYLSHEDKTSIVFRLTSVKECAPAPSGEVCKPETTFEYDNGAALGPAEILNSPQFIYWSGHAADLNGDGTDEFWINGASLPGQKQVYPESFFRPPNGTTLGVPVSGAPIDIENDGREEILVPYASLHDLLFLSYNGAGWTDRPFHYDTTVDWPNPVVCVDQPFNLPPICTVVVTTQYWAIDLTGDGMKDVLVCQGNALGYLDGSDIVRNAVSNNVGMLHVLPSWGNCEDMTHRPPLFVDVDGDGTVNLLRPEGLGSKHWKALVITSASATWVNIDFGPQASGPFTPTGFQTLDVNGDGLMDVLSVANTLQIPWINHGDYTFQPGALMNGAPGIVFDGDGDGNDDLWQQTYRSRWVPPNLAVAFDSTPRETAFVQFMGGSGAFDAMGNPFLADTDGDGDADLIEVADAVHNAGNPCRNVTTHEGEADGCKVQRRAGHSRRMHLLTHVVERVADGAARDIVVTYNGRATQTNPDACKGNTDLLCPRKLPPLVGQHTFSTIAPGQPALLRKTYRYAYTDARAGTRGRGSYGFGGRTITEFEGGANPNDPSQAFAITEDTYYNENFALAGLVKTHKVTSGQTSDTIPGIVQGAKRVVEEQRDYGLVRLPTPPNPHIAFPALSQTRRFVYDGLSGGLGLVSKEVDTFTLKELPSGYDEFGNNRYHEHVSYDGANVPVSGTVTTRSFKPANTDRWLVALLDSMDITASRIGVPEQPRRLWTYQYDPDGRLTLRTRAPGDPLFERLEGLTYDPIFHNLSGIFLNAGEGQPNPSPPQSTLISYDASETFPLFVSNTLGHQAELHFDPRHGGVIATIDPNQIVETRTYDAFGRLREVDGPDGHARITLNRRTDLPASLPAPGDSAAMRIVTEQLSSAGPDIGATVIEDYGPFGEIVKRSVTGYQTPSGADQWIEETFEYDVAGRLRKQSRPHLAGDTTQGMIELVYDKLGVLVQEIYPDASTVRHVQATRNTWLGGADFGQLFGAQSSSLLLTTRHTSTLLPANYQQSSIRVLDPDGDTLTARDAMGTLSDYAYGPFGELRSVQGVRGSPAAVNIFYDTYGRKTRHVDPDLGTETYDEYDSFDQLRAFTDGRGTHYVQTFDPLGRILEAKGYFAGSSTPAETRNWDYDGVAGDPGANEIGRLVRERFSTNAETDRHVTRYRFQSPFAGPRNFGLLDTVERKIGPDVLTTGFEYDGFLRVNLVRYPHLAGPLIAVGRGYDGRGNPTSVFDASDPSKKYWEVTDTHEGYQIATQRFGNGVLTNANYEDLTGRLSKILTTVDTGSGPATLQDLVYLYFPNGNLQAKNDHKGKSETYTYDALERLRFITPSGGSQVEVARYDERGRFTFKVGVGNYDYNHAAGLPAPLHAPAMVQGNGPTRSFFYDTAGNETMRVIGSQVRTTDYTPFNMPSSISDSSGQTTFEYDSNRRRVLKVETRAGSIMRQTLYAGPLYERVDDSTSGQRELTHKYKIFALGKQVAQFEHAEVGGAEDKVLYLHADHLGSTQLVTKASGPNPPNSSAIIAADQSFDPWGKPDAPAWDGEAAKNVHTGFTGHEHDPESGLINMGGRIYDPDLGQFLTPDPWVQSPFNSQSLNRYAYALNNPLLYTDPEGFAPQLPITFNFAVTNNMAIKDAEAAKRPEPPPPPPPDKTKKPPIKHPKPKPKPTPPAPPPTPEPPKPTVGGKPPTDTTTPPPPDPPPTKPPEPPPQAPSAPTDPGGSGAGEFNDRTPSATGGEPGGASHEHHGSSHGAEGPGMAMSHLLGEMGEGYHGVAMVAEYLEHLVPERIVSVAIAIPRGPGKNALVVVGEFVRASEAAEVLKGVGKATGAVAIIWTGASAAICLKEEGLSKESLDKLVTAGLTTGAFFFPPMAVVSLNYSLGKTVKPEVWQIPGALQFAPPSWGIPVPTIAH